MDHRVKKVLEHMHNNLHRRISVEGLALTINLSPSRLRCVFKAETGISFARHLRMLRMQKAKHLLETTFLSVKEIMVEVGLSNESHFVRSFEKAFGYAPAKYRDFFLRSESEQARVKQRDES